MGDAFAFLGVLVTILVLCVITDESNFLLRIIISLLRKPLCNRYRKQLDESSGGTEEKWVHSVSRIKFNELLLDKGYLSRFICLLTSEFPVYLDVTLYILLYAIALFCLDEFHGWLFQTSYSFFTLIAFFTALSATYWLHNWIRFCMNFKSSFNGIVSNIGSDVEQLLANPTSNIKCSINSTEENKFDILLDTKYQPKTIFKGRELDRKFRFFICFFILASVASFLFLKCFPVCFQEWSQILNKELIRHVCFLFIILNFFVLPILFTWFCGTFIEWLKTTLKQLVNWSKIFLRFSGKVILLLISNHFIALLILVYFFLLGFYQ